MQRYFVLLAIILSSILSSQASLVVHERRTRDDAWSPTRRVAGDVAVPLRIGLRQKNLDTLPAALLAVADPESPLFGQHWAPARVASAFAPDASAHDAVRTWLLGAGVDAARLRVSAGGAWIIVQNATVAEAERLLETEYRVYQHVSGDEHVGCHSYSVPEHLRQHIDLITPTVQSGIKLHTRDRPRDHARTLTKRDAAATNASLASCGAMMTPACIRALYGITYTPQATSQNSFAFVSHRPNIYLQSDLDMFFANFSPSLVGSSPTFVSIDGGSVVADNATSHGEDDGILEYAMSLVAPQNVTLLQVGDANTGGFLSFNEWLDAVDGSYCTFEGGDDLTFDPQFPNPFPGGLKEHSCGTLRPPNVIVVSQGDQEYRLSPFYTQRQCGEFAKLGLMGVTVLFGAGDTGTAGAEGYCLDDNGSLTPNGTRFHPTWPSACPWITSVGGTQLTQGALVTDAAPEEVWNQDLTMGFFESGGGGFSNRFGTPAYQQTAVETFLRGLRQSNPSLLAHFNASGRAFPDISAIATNYVVAEDGAFTRGGGVSIAGPVVASMITLISDARIAAGKKPVGFINPTIYSSGFASAFNDITRGVNTGCKGLQGDRAGGFNATSGWDPASGLGTPRFQALLEKWLALP